MRTGFDFVRLERTLRVCISEGAIQLVVCAYFGLFVGFLDG